MSACTPPLAEATISAAAPCDAKDLNDFGNRARGHLLENLGGSLAIENLHGKLSSMHGMSKHMDRTARMHTFAHMWASTARF